MAQRCWRQLLSARRLAARLSLWLLLGGLWLYCRRSAASDSTRLLVCLFSPLTCCPALVCAPRAPSLEQLKIPQQQRHTSLTGKTPLARRTRPGKRSRDAHRLPSRRCGFTPPPIKFGWHRARGLPPRNRSCRETSIKTLSDRKHHKRSRFAVARTAHQAASPPIYKWAAPRSTTTAAA